MLNMFLCKSELYVKIVGPEDLIVSSSTSLILINGKSNLPGEPFLTKIIMIEKLLLC